MNGIPVGHCKLDAPAGRRVPPRAEAFMVAFQEHLKTINRSLLHTARKCHPNWHEEQVKKRNELVMAYQSALAGYLSQPTAAFARGEQVLRDSKTLAAELSDYRRTEVLQASEAPSGG